MKSAWILVADSNQARIFSAENSKADLIEIEQLLHVTETDSDLPNTNDAVQTTAGSALIDESVHKEQEAIHFALRVANHLTDELNQNKYEQLFIIAAPAFLGHLRKSLSTRVEKHISFSLGKNIVALTPKEIRTYLPLSLAS